MRLVNIKRMARTAEVLLRPCSPTSPSHFGGVQPRAVRVLVHDDKKAQPGVVEALAVEIACN